MTYRFSETRRLKESVFPTLLHSRADAGQQLAAELGGYAYRDDVLILALPRGGVPVAYEIAKALQVPFDVCLVRKLGLPERREVAMGAIAPDGVRILNDELIRNLAIPNNLIEQVVTTELKELQRRDRLYRSNRSLPNLLGQTIILVDDGIATGATVRAAIVWLKAHPIKEIVVAVPVAPASVCKSIAHEVDRLVCLMTPRYFLAVGRWYKHFGQVSDDEVVELLGKPMV